MKNKTLQWALLFISFAAVSCSKLTLEIGSVGETMAFDRPLIEVKAGASVKLTLKNNATSAAMLHNWVLVTPGKEAEIAGLGLALGPAQSYLPESPDVLAHTRMVKPGESDTIEFKAPSTPGSYPYICTFPGHFTTMRGILEVK